MELFYLIGSIVSTALTSSALSILILLRICFRRLYGRRRVEDYGSSSVRYYSGTVWHERRRPVRHSFSYPVRYALYDLGGAADVPEGHLSVEYCRLLCGTNGSVFLLTIPPSVGYEQNPLSVYYCYDVDGSTQVFRKCIAEVTNTPWGERVTFVFDPNSDLVAKPLHVSPFMACILLLKLFFFDMHGNWSMKTSDPGDSLHIVITVHHPSLGNYFSASLTARRVDSSSVDDHSMFFWLMPHKVAFWIYWHALKLLWKGVPFVPHPRCQTPTYREDALDRNEVLHSRNVQLMDSKTRCFEWRDAKWPWC
ncbi:hypothetical protein M569_04301 [Genlisea aurea]|uniref:DUF1365 domain-containing protein n=1 Tax=Genlisea aurea TaxID=192259 RepID=S8ED57_9LAMI|nr:hypothetical protein M569_04301 [Genlisea aurea]